jgi:hypothetical protein
MKQVLTLNKGIDKDSNPLYLGEGSVLSRKNCRVISTEGNREGINVSIKGMQQTAYSFGGVSKEIGFTEDKEREQGILFVYNSLGNHKILKISDGVITDLNVPSGVLNFQSDEIIDADILGDFCVFVSDENPPRKIDITDDLSGKDSYDIQLAVRPPSEKPVTVLGSDSSKNVNKLIGKSFQFATMYIYEDNTYSVLSPYSDIVISSSNFLYGDETYIDNDVENFVNVTYDLGNNQVKAIRLLAREGNIGDWFIVEEFEKNGATGDRTYRFDNDIAREFLTETEAKALYSDVPRIARTVKTVQNRVALGNVLKGYDKTDSNGKSPFVTYSVEYEDVTIGGTPDDIPYSDGDINDTYYIEWTIPPSEDFSIGDSVSVDIDGGFSVTGINVICTWDYAASFVVTQSDIDSGDIQNSIANRIASNITQRGYDGIVLTFVPEDVYDVIVDGVNLGGGVVRMQFIGVKRPTDSVLSSILGSITRSDAAAGVSTNKAGSYRNIGVLFYDEFSRTSGVLNQQRIYVPHAGERDYENAFDRAVIAFNITDPTLGVPEWAKYYRFAITESVNFAGVFPFVVGNDNDENIRSLFLDGQNVLAINMPTNLQYEFAKGDYLQIEIDNGVDAITSTIVKNIIGTRTTIEVGGTNYDGFWLIVPAGTEVLSTYDGKPIYIYRPKNEIEDLIYFEDGSTYDIVNGEMQTTSGYIGGEDAWYCLRTFEWDDGEGGTSTFTPTVEDFYVSVNSALRAYTKGRPVVEFDTLGEIRLQDIVWSFNYLDNTKINGISTFNSLNRKQLDERDGELQRLELVGYVLKAIQDNKETSLYVGVNEITDANGNITAAATNDFIGTVRPLVDDYGTRYPLSVVQHDRNMWYFDGDKGVVVQSSPNGQIPVSDYRMKSEFLRLSKLDLNSVFACYDEKNGEYVITFDINGQDPVTWVYNADNNFWSIELDYADSSGNAPNLHGSIGTQVYSFGFNGIWRHETSDAYNSFFGDLKEFSVRGLVNVYAVEEKCLRALQIDSNVALNVNIFTPVTNTNVVGQKSILYSETFRNRNGNYTSSVFKNILGSGGTEIIGLLHSGDDMVGKYIEIELYDYNTDEIQMRNVTCNYTLNR